MQHSWREELAWAAGFFDGEGSTCLLRKKSGVSNSVVLSIHQTDPVLLQRFKDAVGNLGYLGGPYWPPCAQKLQRKPIWQYQTSGFKQVQAIMAQLWTFLSHVKKAQYKKAVTEFFRTRKPNYQHNLPSCDKGHEYTKENTAIRADGYRACRTCRREGKKRRAAQRRVSL